MTRRAWVALLLACSLASALSARAQEPAGEAPTQEPADDEPVVAERVVEEPVVEEDGGGEAGEAAASDDADGEDRQAAEGSGAPEQPREAGEPPSIPRRPVPNYDGREDAPPSAEEVLLWIPRILFFPLHVVFEYVLRQPIGWLMTTAEREQWQVVLVDFFTWDERNAGLVPTAFFDFGFQPSAGLYFFWNGLGAEENDFRAQIGFGGVDWLRATISDRVRTSRETELAFTVDAWRRPDYAYQGLGWDSLQDRRSRYFRNYVEGEVDFRFRPWRASEISFEIGVTWNDFEPEGYGFTSDDPSLQTAVMQGWYDTPPGFDGYTAYHQRLDLVIDSREDRPAPGHGVRVEGFADQGFDLTSPTDRRWVRYGGALGGFLDIGSNRVLALWGLARFADSLGAEPVPFIEQVQLGGDPLIMAGFLRGSLIGQSAVVATLEYRYPIWVFLDGSLHFSVGNVFGEHLEDFEFDRLRMSFGLGLRSIGDRDQSVSFLIAFGSQPFAMGANIDSVRFVVGSQQGF